MVSPDNQEHPGSVTDIKQARIAKNLAELSELVNSSPETRERTMEYLIAKRPAKTNAERQAEYRAKAKGQQQKKHLNYFVSVEAYEALNKEAKATGKTKMDALEALLLQSIEPKPDIAALQNEINSLKAHNLKLLNQYDTEHSKAVTLQSQNEGLKLDANKLRAEIVRLRRLEHDCQAVKADGQRCERTAKTKVTYHGVLIHVCLQHKKQLETE